MPNTFQFNIYLASLQYRTRYVWYHTGFGIWYRRHWSTFIMPIIIHQSIWCHKLKYLCSQKTMLSKIAVLPCRRGATINYYRLLRPQVGWMGYNDYVEAVVQCGRTSVEAAEENCWENACFLLYGHVLGRFDVMVSSSLQLGSRVGSASRSKREILTHRRNFNWELRSLYVSG